MEEVSETLTSKWSGARVEENTKRALDGMEANEDAIESVRNEVHDVRGEIQDVRSEIRSAQLTTS